MRVREPDGIKTQPMSEVASFFRQLTQQLPEKPNDPLLRERLALTALLLGALELEQGSEARAQVCWQNALDHLEVLLLAEPYDAVAALAAGTCCSRIMANHPTDPFFCKAEKLFRRCGDQLTGGLSKTSTTSAVWDAYIENQCSLAACYWRVGKPELGKSTFAELAGRLRNAAGEHLDDEAASQGLLTAYTNLGIRLSIAGFPKAACSLAQDANAVFSRYVAVPGRSHDALSQFTSYATVTAALLARLGKAEESLRLAEEIRQISEDVCRRAPDAPHLLSRLSLAWERVAKAQVKLNNDQAALAAFEESMKAKLHAFELAPQDRSLRVGLSRCYERWAGCSANQGDLVRAAQMHREREKLWNENGQELSKIAKDFSKFADLAKNKAEGEAFQKESQRIRLKAEGLLEANTY
jgi:tetratricopeptide (TPR) repeat protein